MSETKKTTKIAAVAASLAIVASGGAYASSIYGTAKAEEAPTEQTVPVPVEGIDGAAPVALTGASDTAEGTGMEIVAADDGTNVVGNDGAAGSESGTAGEAVPMTADGTENGTTTPTTPTEPSTPSASNPPVLVGDPYMNTSSETAAVGAEVVISMTQRGPSQKADGYDSFSMTMQAPPDGLEVKEIRVREGNEIIYSNKRSNQADNRGSSSQTANGYTFNFSDEYLRGEAKTLSDGSEQGGMGYSGTSYTMEMVVVIPSNMKLLEKYKTDSGNVSIPLNMRGSVRTTSGTSAPVVKESGLAEGKAININLPKLAVMKTMSAESAQVYDTVTYDLKISNTNTGSSAKGVHVIDKEKDLMAALGITPQNVKATIVKNGVSMDVPASQISVSNGTIDISLGMTEIGSNDNVHLIYSITAGTDEMKTNKGKLKQLLDMDADNKSGERTTTVTADNAFESAQAETYFNLLIPAVTQTSSVSKDTITTGERATVTVKFKVEGESGAKLLAPKINLSPAAVGRIENVRVNGASYTPGDVLPDTVAGTDIVFTYDLIAPDTYSDNVNNGIDTTATLSADNIVNNVVTSTNDTHVNVAIPQFSVALETSTKTPSAEDASTGTHPVTVKATFAETDPKARATGVRFAIVDKAAKDAEVPTSSIFQNVCINGVPANASEYSISGNTLTIDRAVMEAKEEVVVTYDDYIKESYEPNGFMQTISAQIQKGAGTSNFPDNGSKTALADYTVQIPALHIAKEVTEPLVETITGEGDDAVTASTPAVINVGDTVKFKTTFFEGNEDMPEAIGRDFVLTEKIEDLFISNEKPSDKEANEKAEAQGEGEDTRDAETKNEDAKKDGRTYKPSQLGITFCPVDEIRVMSGDTDVTDAYSVLLNDDASEVTVKAKNDKDPQLSGDLTKTPTDLVFSVKMGKYADDNNYDQLAGKEIKVSSNLAVSNLASPVTAVSTTQIADAEVRLSKTVKDKEIRNGDTDTYTITAVNDPDDKFDSNSVARNLKIEDDLDEAAAKFGYKIDRSTLKVMLGDDDITSTSDVIVLWEDGDTGFDITLSDDLSKNEELVITYDATTVNIPATAYSQSLGNIVIATADNSKPAVASASVNYAGMDIPADPTGQAGSIGADGAAGGASGSLGATGDIVPYVIGGVIAVAVIGGVVVAVIRRRNQ